MKKRSERWIDKLTLHGSNVELRPLNLGDEDALKEAANDGKLSELWFTSVPSNQHTHSYIMRALEDYDKQIAVPFAVVEKNLNKVIGTTRYTNLDATNKRLEIGFTWYAKSFHRSTVNRECKLLLLSYAFEKLNCIAVEFRTHHQNMISRTAILNLGAKQDGILRSHQIDRAGGLRNTVVFSIIREEWPQVKKELIKQIKKVSKTAVK